MAEREEIRVFPSFLIDSFILMGQVTYNVVEATPLSTTPVMEVKPILYCSLPNLKGDEWGMIY